MIEIEKNGKTYKVKSELNEINLQEFERIGDIYNSDDNNVTKYIKIVTELGLPYEISDQLGYKSLIKIVKELNLKGGELKSEFKLGDREFKLDDLEELSAGKLSKIESIYVEEKDMKSARIISVLTNTEDVEFLYNNLTVDIAGPILTKIDLDLLENLNVNYDS